ncbi:hypothetical protein QTP88_015291 [Uroleucon formosanum]
MSQAINDKPITNTPSKLDALPNTYNTPIVPDSTSNTDTSPFETLNIASEPTSPSNLPPTAATTPRPTPQNLDAIPNSDVVPIDITQPSGTKRSLPDSFLTLSAPPSPLELNENSTTEPRVPPKQKLRKKNLRKQNQSP